MRPSEDFIRGQTQQATEASRKAKKERCTTRFVVRGDS